MSAAENQDVREDASDARERDADVDSVQETNEGTVSEENKDSTKLR